MYNWPLAILSHPKYKIVLSSILVLCFSVLFCSAVTASGMGVSLKHAARATDNAGVTTFDTANAVTVGLGNATIATKRAGISTGMAFYTACSTISHAASQTGKTIVTVSTGMLNGIASGIQGVGRGVGHGVVAVINAPSKAVTSVTHGQVVDAMIRPSTDDEVQAIDGETSSEVLNKLEAEQRAQIAKLLENQKIANSALAGSVLIGDANHGARQDSMVDDWGMYNRECVSYTAWKVHQTYGNMPFWGGIGNANQWVRNAKNSGIPTGSIPRKGSVAISMAGYYGHAMWVEAVEGNRIYISQYNYDLRGHYSEMWIDGRNLTYIYFQ
jgi:surface antigen